LFKIREHHHQALRADRLRLFEDRAIQHLRGCFPLETRFYSDDQLRERVRDCVGRANACGLTTEQQVIAFVDVTYIAGERFDADPHGTWVNKLSRNPLASAQEKMDVLLSMINCGFSRT
jgi:hypothetical protein